MLQRYLNPGFGMLEPKDADALFSHLADFRSGSLDLS